MKLDPTTYGSTPAAMYLVSYLNEKDDTYLNRKVGSTLTHHRQLINDVAKSFEASYMLPSTFTTLIAMIQASIKQKAVKINDRLCQDLVTNIIVGELKDWKKRMSLRRIAQKKIERATPDGKTVPLIPITSIIAEDHQARVEFLQQRSAEKLAKQGKKNTLY